MGADDEWDERTGTETPVVVEPEAREHVDSSDELPNLHESAEVLLLKELLETQLALGPSRPETLSTGDDLQEAPKDKARETVGGFSFFLSLAALLPAGILSLILSLYTWHEQSTTPTLTFAGFLVVGILVATFCIRGHFSVLLHEFKHQIVSNFVGNKGKSLVVHSNSGHFEYSYTKKTRHYHAFIALAPYILPLFTFVSSLVAFAVSRGDHVVAASIVGLGYGIDLTLNARDISPVQTDISEIRGGYGVGVMYIAAWNIAILGVLLAWVFHGVDGFAMLLQEFTGLFLTIHRMLTTASDFQQS